MAKRKSKSFDYPVTDGGLITISVTIGNAQLGGTSVDLDTIRVGSGPQILKLPIGAGKDLRGKTVVVRTIAWDVNPQTNNMIVSYEIRGGAAPLDDYLKLTVDKEGDAGDFTATIRFA
jgi:hypothetical protein